MASAKGIDYLPDELLLEIFSNFTTEHLAMTVQHVSCRWREVSQDNSLWKDRAYSPGKTATDDEIAQNLRNMPKLKKFLPKRAICEKIIIDILCNTCRNMKQLEFMAKQRVNFDTLRQILHAFPDLIHFKVPLPQKVDLNFFTLIGQFNKLVTLAFTDHFLDRYLTIEQKVLSLLADECRSLQHLDLGDCGFDDQDIRYFLEKKRYQMLYFSLACYISTETYIALSDCKNLECLKYYNINDDIPDTNIHLFSKLSNLEDLTLHEYSETQVRSVPNVFANNALSHLVALDIGWFDNFEAQTLNAILRNCPNLRELQVSDYCDLDGGFESIVNCSRLEKLTIQCRLILDKSFEYIGAGCHELKHLYVQHCPMVTDKAFEYISAGCPLLQRLGMCNLHKLTDGIIGNLFKCKNLEFLGIALNKNITGIYLVDIPINLVHLKTLEISECENVSKENIEKLQTKMPQLEIEYKKKFFL